MAAEPAPEAAHGQQHPEVRYGDLMKDGLSVESAMHARNPRKKLVYA
jgi:hypothetical protein